MILAVPAIVVLLMGLGLLSWARWLAGRPEAARWLKPAAWVFFICPLVPFLRVGMILAAGQRAAEGADAVTKARILAEATSAAMNASVLSIPLLLLGAIVLAVQTIRLTDK